MVRTSSRGVRGRAILVTFFCGFVAHEASAQSPPLLLEPGFDGPAEAAGCGLTNPPDPTLAVSDDTTDRIVVTVNSQIDVYQKSTQALLASFSLEGSTGFFQNTSACPVNDPKCFFDQDEHRFVVAAITLVGTT